MWLAGSFSSPVRAVGSAGSWRRQRRRWAHGSWPPMSMATRRSPRRTRSSPPAARRSACDRTSPPCGVGRRRTPRGRSVGKRGRARQQRGVMPLAFFSDHAAAAHVWDRAIDINFKGVLNGICAVHDQMIEQGRGHIVNISSIYGNAGTRARGSTAPPRRPCVCCRIAARGVAREDQSHRGATHRNHGNGVWGPGIVNPSCDDRAHGTEHGTVRERLQRTVDPAPVCGPEETDHDDVRYWAITPEDLVRQIVYVIDQPWGVTINDITVRATGEDYVPDVQGPGRAGGYGGPMLTGRCLCGEVTYELTGDLIARQRSATAITANDRAAVRSPSTSWPTSRS